MPDLMEGAESAAKARELNSNLPGFFWVWLALCIFGIASLIAIGHNEGSETIKKSLELASLAVPVTIALYRLGNFWDDYIFDPLFSPKTDEYWHWLGSGMRDARATAAAYLKTGVKTDAPLKADAVQGIYRLAQQLYEGSNHWAKSVKRPLERSKAIRSLIMPLLVIALYDFFHEKVITLDAKNSFLSDYSFLGDPRAGAICLGLALLAIVLYLWLRVRHMKEMYKLVSSEFTECHRTQDVRLRHSDGAVLAGAGCLLLFGCAEARLFCRKDSRVAKTFSLLSSIQHTWTPELY